MPSLRGGCCQADIGVGFSANQATTLLAPQTCSREVESDLSGGKGTGAIVPAVKYYQLTYALHWFCRGTCVMRVNRERLAEALISDPLLKGVQGWVGAVVRGLSVL